MEGNKEKKKQQFDCAKIFCILGAPILFLQKVFFHKYNKNIILIKKKIITFQVITLKYL